MNSQYREIDNGKTLRQTNPEGIRAIAGCEKY